MTTITATDLARELSDVLNRVHNRGEQFTIERNGEPIAVLSPSGSVSRFTVGDFIALLERLPRPDDAFADDLEAIRASQSTSKAPEWPN